MAVKVVPYRESDRFMGNILWPEAFEVRHGRFPNGHPCAAGSEVFRGNDGQCGAGPALDEFRGRGYWASCFPEGDGITYKPRSGQSEEQQVTDIQECFGWQVRPA